jgi:hypothetical protein
MVLRSREHMHFTPRWLALTSRSMITES